MKKTNFTPIAITTLALAFTALPAFAANTLKVTVNGMVPGHNSIDLFAVPQLHSVSEVSAAAAFRRHAVTGWLRAR